MSSCDRCGKEINEALQMSRFNTEMLGPKCLEKEKQHPRYEEAKKREHEEVQKGNYNFEGIGKPSDL